MKLEDIGFYIFCGFIIFCAIGLVLVLFNGFIISVTGHYETTEHSGIITMKWITEGFIIDNYKFEIDNETVLDVGNEYAWYKYNKGDIYNWTTSEWITTEKDWVLW